MTRRFPERICKRVDLPAEKGLSVRERRMKDELASVCTDEEGARARWEGKVDMCEGRRGVGGVGGVGVGERGDGNHIIHMGRVRRISHTQYLPLSFSSSHHPCRSLPFSMQLVPLLVARQDSNCIKTCPEPAPCACSPDEDCIILNRHVSSSFPSNISLDSLSLLGFAMSVVRPLVSQSPARPRLKVA